VRPFSLFGPRVHDQLPALVRPELSGGQTETFEAVLVQSVALAPKFRIIDFATIERIASLYHLAAGR
jgi:hypothetical protein